MLKRILTSDQTLLGIVGVLLTAIGLIVWTRLDKFETKLDDITRSVYRLEANAGTRQTTIGPDPHPGGS